MISFEREMKQYLERVGMEYEDCSSAFDQPDFKVRGRTSMAYIEVKEKRQKIREDVWPFGAIPEHKAFILDELTARKLMQYTLNGALFVRDNTTGLYYFADVMSLWLMPRVRCERDHNNYMKGKWVVDLRNFMGSDRLHDLFIFMRDYLEEAPGLVKRDAAIHRPDFPGEEIVVAGTPRTEEQREHDVQATR